MLEFALLVQPMRKKAVKKVTDAKIREINIIARFIVNKFVNKKTVVWPRDMVVAKKIAKMYPLLAFWEKLDLSPVETLIIWNTEKIHETLRPKWLIFNANIPVMEQLSYGNTKTGTDYQPSQKQIIKSILDFDKNYAS